MWYGWAQRSGRDREPAGARTRGRVEDAWIRSTCRRSFPCSLPIGTRRSSGGSGYRVKLVKFQGPFVWHRHENEDELFLVHKGRFTMEFRDRRVAVEEGEFMIVPRKTEHRPVAEEEVHVVLFEPATTLNTGDVESELTVGAPERI